jgi:hypothetical protein
MSRQLRPEVFLRRASVGRRDCLRIDLRCSNWRSSPAPIRLCAPPTPCRRLLRRHPLHPSLVDDVTSGCLAAIPDKSISGKRVARELTTLIARRSASTTARTPSTPEAPARRKKRSFCSVRGRGSHRWRLDKPRDSLTKPFSQCSSATLRRGIRQRVHLADGEAMTLSIRRS